MWLPAVTDAWPPPVCLFCVRGSVKASAGDWTELREACWEDMEPPQLWRWGFCVAKGHKKRWQKIILVVYNLICFQGKCGKAACAVWALRCCMLWASRTTWWQPTNAWRTADGTCIVLFGNILHEASILTIKVKTIILLIVYVHPADEWCKLYLLKLITYFWFSFSIPMLAGVVFLLAGWMLGF